MPIGGRFQQLSHQVTELEQIFMQRGEALGREQGLDLVTGSGTFEALLASAADAG